MIPAYENQDAFQVNREEYDNLLTELKWSSQISDSVLYNNMKYIILRHAFVESWMFYLPQALTVLCW